MSRFSDGVVAGLASAIGTTAEIVERSPALRNAPQADLPALARVIGSIAGYTNHSLDANDVETLLKHKDTINEYLRQSHRRIELTPGALPECQPCISILRPSEDMHSKYAIQNIPITQEQYMAHHLCQALSGDYFEACERGVLGENSRNEPNPGLNNLRQDFQLLAPDARARILRELRLASFQNGMQALPKHMLEPTLEHLRRYLPEI